MKIFLIVIALMITILQGCSGEKATLTCIPNHEENGVGLLVTKDESHLTTFQFEVCFVNPKRNTSVTIYGFDTDHFSSMNVDAWWRYKNINLQKGARFTVEFHGDDNFFVLYEDSEAGELEKNVQIIHAPLYEDL